MTTGGRTSVIKTAISSHSVNFVNRRYINVDAIAFTISISNKFIRDLNQCKKMIHKRLTFHTGSILSN